MEVPQILSNSGKINEYIHLVDLHEYGIPKILSAYVGEFDNGTIIMDCGSSLDIPNLLKYLKENQISLSQITYLITTHHHFDHNGGMWKLYNHIRKYNPKVRILTNSLTKNLFNDYQTHLERAKRTYGNMVGTMKPIEDKAFELIQPSKIFDENINNLEFHKEFLLKGEQVQLVIFATPGHTPDHQSLGLVRGNQMDFLFLGEAIGTLYHTSKLITTPTSMPTFFNYSQYISSVQNLEKLAPQQAGFAHFGVVKGQENIKQIIREHKEFMKEFRALVVQYYKENPKTKYVVNKLLPYMTKRVELRGKMEDTFKAIVLGVVYGMMMDLGYRKE
ncbi:MAG: MBL fold metallo-hydrolase [Promethearchaeota archaeon]|nr:MAG: MBL fold metallo-hydrolase [Candidatus Lokiarchaeota archaeon]